MPDFNKGDFTQQGVAGHVNANLRLNEKRLVNIDLTSNEEAEGCTIAGTVTDLLNDKVYNISSAVSGNIEITENGENINVAPYATATVNVSGGGGTDLLKTTVTLINPVDSGISLTADTCIIDEDSSNYAFDIYDFTDVHDTPIHALVPVSLFSVYAVNRHIEEGETFIFDLYYMLADNNPPVLATWDSNASDIVNLDDTAAPDYEVIDYTSNSSITLTYVNKEV